MFDIALQDINGEPRVYDIDLGQALGFDRPRNLRKLIARNIDALRVFGNIVSFDGHNEFAPRGANGDISSHKVGRIADKEHFLNRDQCLYLCAKAQTEKAALVTVEMVRVFSNYLDGALPPRTPIDNIGFEAESWLAIIREARMTLGRSAAKSIWESSALPQAPGVNKASDTKDIDAYIVEFIDAQCLVTGRPDHYTYAKDLYDCFGCWLQSQYSIATSMGVLSRAFKRVSQSYRHPETNKRFNPVKRSRAGFAGVLIS